MAISNKDRISRTLDLLREGLVPFVERELKAKLGASWQKAVNDSLREDLRQRADGSVAWDTQGLFTVTEKWWGEVCGRSGRRGPHPAGLSIGEVFAYALAKATGEPLLFKGDDFARTDIASAG
jgi:uncharacterized protein with PIN domain